MTCHTPTTPSCPICGHELYDDDALRLGAREVPPDVAQRLLADKGGGEGCDDLEDVDHE